MKIDMDVEKNIVKNVIVEMSPVEFMLFRQILNLSAVHTQLHEMDGLLASKMYKEIEEYLKEKQK